MYRNKNQEKISKLLLVEPLIKHPIKKQKNGKLADIGVRLNLAYLAGYIVDNSNKFEVSIKPYRFEDYLGKKRNLEQDLKNVDYIGITASSSEYPDALEIAKEAKKQGAVVIMGGIYPSANYEEVLKSGYVDYVVTGEGEDTLLDLLNTIEDKEGAENVKGVAYLKGNEVSKTKPRALIQDIDKLRPAYELLPMKEYAKHVNSAPIYSARGCFGKCEFCTVSKHWNSTYRARSVENIINEINILKEFGFKKVNFKDESLTLKREQAIKLFDSLAEKNFGLEYKGKTRLDDIDSYLLEKMKKANFKEIHFGVESLNEETLKNIQKGISREDIIYKIKLALEKGFTINPSIILGSPGDTKKSLNEIAEFIKNIYKKGKVKVYTCLNTPHHGSVQRMKAKERGLTIISNDLNKYTHFQLVSIPKSLGEPEKALKIISEIQRKIVTAVNGPEPLIDLEEIIQENPMLEDLA